MNTVQIISLIAAIALGFLYVKPYLVKTTAALKKDEPPVKTEKDFQPTMSDVVDSWSKLKSNCETLGLTDASDALDSVFPLFVKKKSNGL
jgi:hypothetical protein